MNFKTLEDFEEKVMKKLNLDENEFSRLRENEFEPEERLDDEVKEYNQEDLQNECLNIIMKQSIEKIFPDGFQRFNDFIKTSGIEDMQKINDFKCKNHEKRSVCYVCVNPSCKYVFFCQGCLAKHNKECDREHMIMNNEKILSEDYADQYYDYEDFEFENKRDLIKEKFSKLKDKISTSLDVLEKVALDKISFFSKEYNMRRIKATITRNLEDFKETKNHKSYYRVAYDNFRLQQLSEFEKMPSCEEEIKKIDNLISNLEKNLAKDLTNYKKDCISNSKNTIENLQKEAMKNYNQEIINPRVDPSKIALLKFDNKNLLVVNNIVPKNINQPTSQPSINEENNNPPPTSNTSTTGDPSAVLKRVYKDCKNHLKEDELNILSSHLSGFSSSKLIYNIPKEGFSASKFHNKCDSVSPTLLLCVTSDKKRFGCVSYVGWGEEESEVKTDKNFIFSLDHQSIHILKEENGTRLRDDAIDYDEELGPLVGLDDIKIEKNCDKEESSSSTLGGSYEAPSGKSAETYLAGKANFKIKKLYVFELK